MSEKGETLTEAMLAALPASLRPIRSGKYLRAGCPFHGSETQRSLSIDTETGRFQCFSCNAWGYTEESRQEWKRQHGGQANSLPSARAREMAGDRLRADSEEPQPLEASTLEQLQAWQLDLPEAAEYLASRRIPLELVREMGGGVGTLGNARRLVLPHTDPTGRIVSLYGRRIDGGQEHKHHHLSGRSKGWLNAKVSRMAELWITEGPFDALALMAAGIPHAAAVFGTQGIRWGWLGDVRRLVLAFDLDEAGQRALTEHAKQAFMRGLEVLRLAPDELGGAKDISEAWTAGTLNLIPLSPLPSRPTEAIARLQRLVSALPDAPPSGLQGAQWVDYKTLAVQFVREHAAEALALGWTELELFGLPPPLRSWQGGALWLLAGRELASVTAEQIQGTSSQGAASIVQRSTLRPERLPWPDP